MKICIPTRGRPNRQITAQFLKRTGVEYLLICNSDDLGDYSQHPHVRISANNLREKRQWILENQREQNRVIMMDDDLTFSTRTEDNKLPPCKPRDGQKMLVALDRALDTHAHASIVARPFAIRQPHPYFLNGKCYRVLAYNCNLFPKPWPRFRLVEHADHDFNLQLLAQGCANCILTDFTQRDPGQTYKGGCNTYRTPESTQRELQRLMDAWPGVITLKGERPRIAWRKAWRLHVRPEKTLFD